MAESNKLILVGLGRLGQEVLLRTPRNYNITCIDLFDTAEQTLADLKREDVTFIKGDATSRLVLEDCGVDDADIIVLTMTEQKMNIEVARVLTEHFNPRRIISLAITEDGERTLKAMDVETENIFVASALGIRNKLEQKTRTPHAIGIGKEEILEVEVNPNSRLANKKLGFLKPINWRLGIIYRDGNIIVPKHETILRPRDKVVILGDPRTLKTVTDILTFNFEKFPLEYGSTMIAFFSDKDAPSYTEEINYIYSTLPLKKTVLVYRDGSDALKESVPEIENAEHYKSSLSDIGAVEAAISSHGSTGLIVLSMSYMNSLRRGLFGDKRRGFISRLIKKAKCPVIIAGGTFPYQELVMPCLDDIDFESVIDSSFQLASELHGNLTTLIPKPSAYISDSEDVSDYKSMQSTISALSSTYKLKTYSKELEGNPIKEISLALMDYNMAIMSFEESSTIGVLADILNPDISWGITKRSTISTLLLPSWEDTL
ncbi:NAD-binding protein [Nitrospirota bacterium]